MSEIPSKEAYLPGETANSSECEIQDRRVCCGFGLLAALLLVLTAAVRLLFITRYDVWLDEAYCFAVARKGIGMIIADLRFDNGPPLYYMLLHYWMALFGESEFALRSLSAVFSTGAVAGVIFWNAPWFSKRARLAGGFLFAITPLAIYYGQETRMYSLVLFLVIMSTVFLEKGLRAGGAKAWILFGAFTLLSFYTSYVAFFLAPLGYLVIGISYAIEADGKAVQRRLTGLIISHVAVAVLFAPWVGVLVRQPSEKATQWMRPQWAEASKPLLPLQSLTVMTTGGAYYPSNIRHLAQGPERTEALRKEIREGGETRAVPRLLSKIPPIITLLLTVALSGVLIVGGLRSKRIGLSERALMVAWVALAPMVPFFASYVRPMYFVGRYELTGVPAFVVISGLGIAALRKPLRIGAVLLAAVLFLYSWGYMMSFPRTGPYRDRGAALAELASEGDVALCMGFEYAPVYYYAGSARERIEFITFPRETILHAAWIDYDKWLYPAPAWSMPKDVLADEAGETLDEAISAAGSGKSVWIVRDRAHHPWFDAMNDAFMRPLSERAQSNVIIYDKEGSRPDKGILRMAVP